MADKADLLRSLHRAPPILVLPNAWDAATARVFEAAGFPAVATTSAGVAAALGYPDGGGVPAIERGKAYREAGADCIFVPGVRDPATISALVAGIGGPINILATAGAPPVGELEKLGVARVTVGSGPMRAALALVRDVARELKTTGTYSSFTTKAMTFNDVNELMA